MLLLKTKLFILSFYYCQKNVLQNFVQFILRRKLEILSFHVSILAHFLLFIETHAPSVTKQ